MLCSVARDGDGHSVQRQGRPRGRHAPGIAAGTTTAQRLQLLEQADQRQQFACSLSGVLRQQTVELLALEWPDPTLTAINAHAFVASGA